MAPVTAGLLLERKLLGAAITCYPPVTLVYLQNLSISTTSRPRPRPYSPKFPRQDSHELIY
jgi:hypothetical protein